MIYISYSACGFAHYNKKIKIKQISTSSYRKFNLIGTSGVIKRYAGGKFGVLLDDIRNPASREGLFWFNGSELTTEELESEDVIMTGYNYIAIVNMFNDLHKKDYSFALYDAEKSLLTKDETLELSIKNPLVVTNANGKNNRVLAIVKEIKTVEEYKTTCNNKITAQIVGVVNMDAFLEREENAKKAAELKQKKDNLISQIQARADKLKDLAYFEHIAEKFADIDPRLKELVNELKELDGISNNLNKSTE